MVAGLFFWKVGSLDGLKVADFGFYLGKQLWAAAGTGDRGRVGDTTTLSDGQALSIPSLLPGSPTQLGLGWAGVGDAPAEHSPSQQRRPSYVQWSSGVRVS